jgi:hypothetical protein
MQVNEVIVRREANEAGDGKPVTRLVMHAMERIELTEEWCSIR